MIPFAFLIVLLTLLEIKQLKNNKRDAFVYSILAVAAVALGFYYLSNPMEADLVSHILRLFRKSY